MKAAWHEKHNAGPDFLTVSEMDEPQPGAGEVRICVDGRPGLHRLVTAATRNSSARASNTSSVLQP
jgi:hypothetical protein